MGLNTALTDAAASLAAAINSGNAGARANLGGGGTAFAWTTGISRTIADYVTTAESGGMSFPITSVTESATPAGIVAPAGAKPHATAIAASTVNLQKFAGYAQFTLEAQLDAKGLAAAVSNVLGGSTLKAFETNAISVLDAGAGSTVTGTDWVSAVANAQAAVLGAGGTPSVLVVSHLDYGAFVQDVLATSAFSQDPDSPVGALLGTPIHISAGAATGKAWVVDSSAVVCVQHESSPLVVIDGVSLAKTNEAVVVVDLIAATFIAAPKGVVEITAPVVAGTSSATSKRK